MIKFFLLCVIVQFLNVESKSVGKDYVDCPSLAECSDYEKYVQFKCWTSPTNSFNSPIEDNLVERGLSANDKSEQ